MDINIETVKNLRKTLRACLPDLSKGVASNETLSACFSLLTEALTLRLVVELQLLRRAQIEGREADDLMREVSERIGGVLSDIMLKHLPDASVVNAFRSMGTGTKTE